MILVTVYPPPLPPEEFWMMKRCSTDASILFDVNMRGGTGNMFANVGSDVACGIMMAGAVDLVDCEEEGSLDYRMCDDLLHAWQCILRIPLS